jgi:MFS family permease
MRNEEAISPHSIRNILVRDYVLSFLAFFGFLSAFHALIPTLPIYLVRLGSNEREIGFLVGTASVTSLISRLLVGRMLLKHSERQLMIWGAALCTLSFLALIVFRPFWPLFIVRLVQGLALASVDTAVIAYAIRIVPVAYRARSISYFFVAPSLAMAISASSSVFVVNAYGFTVLFFACTGLSLCVVFVSCKLKAQETKPPVSISAVKNDLLFERKIIAPAMVTFLLSFAWGGISAFFPLYSIECGVSNPGLFFSASAVMVVVGRLLGGSIFEKYRKETIIPGFTVVTTMALVTLAFSRTLPMFIVVGLLWGLASAFVYPASMAYALEYAGSSGGTAVATYQACFDMGLAFGPVTMGIMVPFTGYRVMFLFLAFTCLINLGYFQFYLRKKGNMAHTV